MISIKGTGTVLDKCWTVLDSGRGAFCCDGIQIKEKNEKCSCLYATAQSEQEEPNFGYRSTLRRTSSSIFLRAIWSANRWNSGERLDCQWLARLMTCRWCGISNANGLDANAPMLKWNCINLATGAHSAAQKRQKRSKVCSCLIDSASYERPPSLSMAIDDLHWMLMALFGTICHHFVWLALCFDSLFVTTARCYQQHSSSLLTLCRSIFE